MFTKLKRLEDQKRCKKQEAREILFPSNNFNEQQAVRKWFSSDICKEEEIFCEKLFIKCTSGSKVSGRDFVRFGNFARFQTAMEDRNRSGVYSLTNKEFDTFACCKRKGIKVVTIKKVKCFAFFYCKDLDAFSFGIFLTKRHKGPSNRKSQNIVVLFY